MKPPAEARAGVLALLLAAVAAVGGARADWPSFRGDPALSGVAGEALPADLETVWTYQGDEGIESTAAIVDGAVYVGFLDGSLRALSLADGRLLWSYDAGEEIKSSPAVKDGVVYFGDEGGGFHAVDAASGKEKWTFTADAGVISSAAFGPCGVLFGSQDNSLYCVRTGSGELAWKVETGSYVYATPARLAVAGREAILLAGCDGLLRVVDAADGSEIKTIEMGAYVGASPAVREGRAFVGTFENQVLGLDLAAGQVAWAYENPERQFPYYSSAAVTADRIIVGGRDKVIHALDPDTGKAIWTHAAGARVDSSPVVAGDVVWVGTMGGDLLALDLDSGRRLWEFATGSAISASPAVSGGRLVIGTLDGALYALGPPEGAAGKTAGEKDSDHE